MSFKIPNHNVVASTPINSNHQLNDSLVLSPIARMEINPSSLARGEINVTNVPNDYVFIQSKLHFGFVRQGTDRAQDLTVNASSRQGIWIYIKTIDNDVFSSDTREVLHVAPNESQTFKILYKPTKQRSFDTATLCLVVEPEDRTKAVQFRVTLLGFSGKSEVIPRGLQVVANNTWEAFIKDGETKFSLKNVGLRAAFVRIVVIDEMLNPSSISDVFIKPDQFVLDGSSSMIVMAKVHSRQKDAKLAVYWGEEKQRLRCKKYFDGKQITPECIMDGVDLAALKINDSRLSDAEGKLLSSDDRRILMSELTVMYIRLTRNLNHSSDTDVTLTSDNIDQNELKIRPAKFLDSEVQAIDDDVETCIRK